MKLAINTLSIINFILALVSFMSCLMAGGMSMDSPNQQLYKYSVKLTRPDGVVHKTFVIESTGQPIIRSTDGGQSEFFEAEKYIYWKMDRRMEHTFGSCWLAC